VFWGCDSVATDGTSVGGSSVEVRSHLQFQRSPGRCRSAEVKGFEREGDATPYLQTSLEESSPAQDDATYSICLENDGAPNVYPGKSKGDGSTAPMS